MLSTTLSVMGSIQSVLSHYMMMMIAINSERGLDGHIGVNFYLVRNHPNFGKKCNLSFV